MILGFTMLASIIWVIVHFIHSPISFHMGSASIAYHVHVVEFQGISREHEAGARKDPRSLSYPAYPRLDYGLLAATIRIHNKLSSWPPHLDYA